MSLNNVSEAKEWLVERVSFETFQSKVKGSIKSCFNLAEFSRLNEDKVDEVHYLIISKGNSARFAVTFGKRGDTYSCPFSAPFGYIEQIKSHSDVQEFEMAAQALDAYFRGIGAKQVTIVLPPAFYDYNIVNAWLGVFFNMGWKTEYVDLSFALHLTDVIDNYEQKIQKNARKNLRIALESGLSLKHCQSMEDKIEAYRVIQENRTSKGYPLRMTQQQVLSTMDIVSSDMYLVSHDGENIAAALVYKVTDKIAQVVYWGDIPGNTEKKPINFLSYHLMHLYAERGFEYLDIGPSTEGGIPNYGLCNFKDSIGCERTVKFRMTRCYNED